MKIKLMRLSICSWIKLILFTKSIKKQIKSFKGVYQYWIKRYIGRTTHVEALLINAIMLKQIIKNKLSINNFTLIFLHTPYNF